MLRKGIKTTEFWVTLIAGVFVTVQSAIWPDSPFPKQEFMAMLLWVAARVGQKSIGPADTGGERAWKTSEFWVAIVYSIVSYIFPTIPKEIFDMVAVYIIGRPITKVTKNINL